MSDAPDKAPTGKAILVVEDSPTEGLALRNILTKGGHRPALTRRGDEALKLLESQTFDLVLSDIDMPGLNGYEMCLAIKGDPRWQAIPVILLTTLTSPLNILQGLKARADYYLTKPYTAAFLLSRVNQLLAHPPGAPDADAPPLPVFVEEQRHEVTAGRRQMINLLLSTYDCAVRQNQQLIATQAELNDRNEQLRVQQEQLRLANEQLQALATTDGLTGLKNHRTFKERLEDEFERSVRYHIPLSLMMIDVDHFKQYNDSFGHPAGDEVLKKVGELLHTTTRNTDLVARYGGEEFAVLLPYTHSDAALALAERTRVAIHTGRFKHRRVSVSVGVATLREQVPTAAAFVALADEALYHSKEQGRNRVSHADDLPRFDAGTTKESPA